MPRRYVKKKSALPKKHEPGFLERLDRRTELSKVLRANRDAILDDLGGEANLSKINQSLVERFVFLEAVLGRIETDMAHDIKRFDELLGKWIQAVNSLTGLAKTLGTDRKDTDQPWKDHGVLEAVE